MSANVRFATRQDNVDPASSSGFNGLPFPTRLATAWDGSTYFDGQPSGSDSEYVPVFGEGTFYPIGFLFDELFRFVWNVKYCGITSSWDGFADDGGGESPLNVSTDFSYGSTSTWSWIDPNPVATAFSSLRTDSEIRDIIMDLADSYGSCSAAVSFNTNTLPASYTFTPSPFDPSISASFTNSWPDVCYRTGFNCAVYFSPSAKVLRSIDNLYYPNLRFEFFQSSDGAITSLDGTCQSYKLEPTAENTFPIVGSFTVTGIGTKNLYFAGSDFGSDPKQSCSITLNPSLAYLWPYV